MGVRVDVSISFNYFLTLPTEVRLSVVLLNKFLIPELVVLR